MAQPVTRHRRIRSAGFWTLGVFAAFTAALVAIVELCCPHWNDREYEIRRAALNDYVAANPDRPVLLVAGSSRMVAGFMPERVGPLANPDGPAPLVFNYSHLGSGPRLNLIQAHRPARDGIHPKWLVVELAPCMLMHDDMPYQEASLRDVPLVLPHANRPRLLAQTARLRLFALHRYRTALLRHAAPALATTPDGEDEPRINALGGAKGWCRFDHPSVKLQEDFSMLAARRFQWRMNTYRIAPHAAGATRDLLAYCRTEGIRVAMVMTPEDTRFLSWYGAGAEEAIQQFVTTVRSEHGVPVIDARRWVPDDGFTDPHHLNLKGAEVFTDRLEVEVLRPIVAGDLLGDAK